MNCIYNEWGSWVKYCYNTHAGIGATGEKIVLVVDVVVVDVSLTDWLLCCCRDIHFVWSVHVAAVASCSQQDRHNSGQSVGKPKPCCSPGYVSLTPVPDYICLHPNTIVTPPRPPYLWSTPQQPTTPRGTAHQHCTCMPM